MNQFFHVCLLLVLIAPTSYAQEYYHLKLTNDTLNPDRQFYIVNVVDNRADKREIGLVRIPETGTKVKAVFEHELETELERYFNYAAPPTEGQTSVTMVIRQLEVGEKISGGLSLNYAVVSADFYVDGKRVFRDKQRVQLASRSLLNNHEANVRKALERVFTAFHYSGWQTLKSPGPAMGPSLGAKERARHLVAVGYQLGGLTYAGVEYELRLDDYLGVNIGAGVKGYTAGLKIHTNGKRNSPFVHLNYKDRDFGSFGIGAVELGGKVPFSQRKNFGLHGQAGLGRVLSGYPNLEHRNFGRRPTGSLLLSLGVGLSW